MEEGERGREKPRIRKRSKEREKAANYLFTQGVRLVVSHLTGTRLANVQVRRIELKARVATRIRRVRECLLVLKRLVNVSIKADNDRRRARGKPWTVAQPPGAGSQA